MRPKIWMQCSAAMICISLVASLLLLWQGRLEGPLFFEHYYEIHMADGLLGYLYGVVNKGEENKVSRVEFLHQGPVPVNLNLVETRTIGQRYSVLVYSLECNGMNSASFPGWDSNLTVTNESVRVTKSGGESEELAIGKIVFLPENHSMPILTQTSGYSSTSNESGFAGRTKMAVSISAVETMFPELLQSGTVQIALNDEALEASMDAPIFLDAGQQYRVAATWDLQQPDNQGYTVYSIQPDIIGLDLEGNRYRQAMNSIGISLWGTTVQDVRALSRYREGKSG